MSEAHYPVQTLDTVSEASRPSLEAVHSKFGKIPNIIGTMANSSVALNTYTSIGKIFGEAGFSPVETQLINLTISVENSCDYCTAAHSTALKKALKVDAETVAAVRAASKLADPKHAALVDAVRELVRFKGGISDETRQTFLDAGYTASQLIDLLSAIAMKTLTNFLDHLTQIELDPAYADEAV